MAIPVEGRRKRAKSAVALLLTFSAGFVDVVGFLALFHVFTANMTGNTVHLANALVSPDRKTGATAGLVVAAFFFGSIIGRAIIEVAARARFRTVATIALALEALLVAAVPFAGWHLQPHAEAEAANWGLLILLAAAMGLQTATLTRIGALTVHTTFVTGMINKLAQLVSRAAFATWDLLRAAPEARAGHRARRQEELSRAFFIFSIWVFYLAGAVSGAALHAQWALRALYLPAAILLSACLLDQFFPLSVEEEKEESER